MWRPDTILLCREDEVANFHETKMPLGSCHSITAQSTTTSSHSFVDLCPKVS